MSFKRFMNLVVLNYENHVYSLRRLNADQFFYPTSVEAATHGKVLPIQRKLRHLGTSPANGKEKTPQPEMESIRLPPVLFSVRPSSCPVKHRDQADLRCFTLSRSKVFFADTGARLFYYDTQRRCAVTTPNLQAPKSEPLTISFPNSADDCPDSYYGEQNHRFYIIEKFISPAKKDQFEALYCRDRGSDLGKTWYIESLPLPPFVHEPANQHASLLCTAVVGEAICISVSGVGTYCFDTMNKTWSWAGNWLMPFVGKAEYIPELKLWFGISHGQLPCAADLSPVVRGHAPGKEYIWGNPDVPDGWHPAVYSPAEIVSLGSGSFCIVNFFRNMHLNDDEADRHLAVFTGLEVVSENGSESGGNGSGKLRMIRHKAKIWDSTSMVIRSVH